LFLATNQFLQKIETGIAALSLTLLLALSIFQILLRNFYDFGYPEIDIINRHLLIICGMMGATLATSKFAHIKIDALSTILSDTTKNYLKLPINLFSCGVCIFLCYYSTVFVSDEWQYAPANERWTLPFTLIYPISFALISIHFLLNSTVDNSSDNNGDHNSDNATEKNRK
jgi:TRAP-type C4-dicarboxylate transport system permease small subunit